MDETTAPAQRFVAALAARDFDGLAAGLAPDVRFRYLVPSGSGELRGQDQATAKFRDWFGDADALEVESTRIEALPDRTSARYRFLLHEQDGWKEVEQQTYVDVDEEERIAGIDLLCSGFRPTAGPGESPMPGTHRFDAGTLGCADGLAQEFRRRILAIPLGDVLAIETSDPAAKEDLPPLARMMGHTVRSVEPSASGRLLITVERGR
jgi:TusA-related sulfurtransferase